MTSFKEEVLQNASHMCTRWGSVGWFRVQLGGWLVSELGWPGAGVHKGFVVSGCLGLLDIFIL